MAGFTRRCPFQEAFGTLTDFRLDTFAVSSYTATNQTVW